eukprot:TRINITY_DN40234_c0_g1_i1.p1 TRINITY_DN40234_c0_g1~~TRINITY_DN40234_c0_g1_i1.p1  ORF type:complete len:133 (+),score=22.28 TRINITY_DN40234_c0_g1_i1:41-439(+)
MSLRQGATLLCQFRRGMRPAPEKACSLCGRGRLSELMEEMGSGSGFYQCQQRHADIDCAPERVPGHLKRFRMEKDRQQQAEAAKRAEATLLNALNAVGEGTDGKGLGSRAVEELGKRRMRRQDKAVSWRERL